MTDSQMAALKTACEEWVSEYSQAYTTHDEWVEQVTALLAFTLQQIQLSQKEGLS